MSEYWKSTPKHWCKYCALYIRDTALERSNHEATAKHQSALKRFLRDLHRGHEAELRDKDRAKREVERLNGLVPYSSSSSASSSAVPAGAGAGSGGGDGADGGKAAGEAQRKRQWQQLADLGIALPGELRADMAMVGEWEVTKRRVVHDDDGDGDEKKSGAATTAIGVRKRAVDEEKAEEEEAVKTLFKKPRRWGREAEVGHDRELEELLSADLVVKKEDMVKEENEMGGDGARIKAEDTGDMPEIAETSKGKEVSREVEAPVPAVVFKKRKPKNIRQK